MRCDNCAVENCETKEKLKNKDDFRLNQIIVHNCKKFIPKKPIFVDKNQEQIKEIKKKLHNLHKICDSCEASATLDESACKGCPTFLKTLNLQDALNEHLKQQNLKN